MVDTLNPKLGKEITMYMDGFKRFLFITACCFIALSGCKENSTNDQEMLAQTKASYGIASDSLENLNPYFYLADTTLSALHLLNAQEGTKEGKCNFGTFTATLHNNILQMEFHDCSVFLPHLNGVLVLELTDIEKEGYLLALNGRLSSRNISWSSSLDEEPELRDDFDVELVQTITGSHRTLTTLNFSESTIASNHLSDDEVVKFASMSLQRQLDYESGIYSIAYDGQITKYNGEDVSVFITTPEPIELIYSNHFLNGTLIIDDGKSRIKASISKFDPRPYSFDIETEFDNGQTYQPGNRFAASFAMESDIFSFTSRTGFLSKQGPILTDKADIKDRFFYSGLSPNHGLVQSPAEEDTQLGSMSRAILPIFNNLGEFTVSIFDRETNLELDSALYSVTLDGIWVNISFDSSLSSASSYSINITDDNGRKIFSDYQTSLN
ncbi:hypothetical protein [Psychromonas sp. MME2]|uniref:hypothetical protein n=1 Tax=unclassified Psychromonas TaxID=2614957 RepID=UPI00339C7C41